ncbi:MAG: hypothetical protein GXO48_07300 [Chlorobi bacterium]|nr:hypothetical protein [Chlorobiota bacterium]
MKWVLKIVKFIPNAITLTSLFLGLVSISYIIESAQLLVIEDIVRLRIEVKPTTTLWAQLIAGAYFIILGAILDFSDGFVARLLNAQSEIGKQLDSLADMVIFGVAPSFILYRLLALSYKHGAEVAASSEWVYFIAFIYAVGVAYRLARFNASNQNQITEYFYGLPAPAAALTVTSLPFALLTIPGIVQYFTPPTMFAIIGTITYLTISKIRMLSLKGSFSPKVRSGIFRIGLMAGIAIAAIILVVFSMPITILFPITMVWYILLSFVYHITMP